MKREFPPTRWTLIRCANDGESSAWQSALDQLCQLYWYPVYAHVRYLGYPATDAEDHTQGFFASLLRRSAFSQLSAEKGKFRSFLLKAVRNYLANDRRRQGAQKRGGDRVIVSLDQKAAEQQWLAEPRSIDDPERLYELAWARTLLQNGLHQLEREHAASAKPELFAALRDRLLEEPSALETRDLAARFDMTESAVRLTAFRMRKRLATILRTDILHTVNHQDEVEEEIDHLLTLFKGALSAGFK